MKNIWMTFVNALRPTAERRERGGQDAHHEREATLSFTSRQESRRSARRAKRDLVAASSDTPHHEVPYDHRMSDRFIPLLSTR